MKEFMIMFKNLSQISVRILKCVVIMITMIVNSMGMDVSFDHNFTPDPNCEKLHARLIIHANYQLQRFGHKCSHHTKHQSFTNFKSTVFDKSEIGNIVCASCNIRLIRNISSDMYDIFKFDLMDSLQQPMCDKHKDENKDNYRWKWVKHNDQGNPYQKDAESDGYIREKGFWNLYGWAPWISNNNTNNYW